MPFECVIKDSCKDKEKKLFLRETTNLVQEKNTNVVYYTLCFLFLAVFLLNVPNLVFHKPKKPVFNSFIIEYK